MTQAFSGSGAGIQTPDGCSVECYRQLPYMDELNDVEPALKKHTSALELGCGTGRLCRRLQELGLFVTGVDESTAMLAWLPIGVEGIRSSIGDLSLGRHWSAVLLPSHLINHPDDLTQKRFVQAARRHVAPSGAFYAKRHSTSWLREVQPGRLGESRGVAYHTESVSRQGKVLSMTLRYETCGQFWTQSFTTSALEQEEVEELLRSCGFTSFTRFGPQCL